MTDERSLARCVGFDVAIEDHGILVLLGHFEYEDGGCQGLGYSIDASFLYRFLAVFGDCPLRKVEGRSCWVSHDDSRITRIEPLHKKDGAVFDLDTWKGFVKQLGLPSPYEMRTGKKP